MQPDTAHEHLAWKGDPAEIVVGPDIDSHALLAQLLLGRIPEWHARANCRGKANAVMFPAKGGTYDEARVLCADCDVTAQCLAEGLEPDNVRHGFRAGLTPEERIAMQRPTKRGTNATT